MDQETVEKKKNNTLIIIVIVLVGLLILAIPVALIVVGLSLQVMDSGSGVPEYSAKATWKSAEPLGIVDWGRTDDTLTVVFRNNVGNEITLNEFDVSKGTNYVGEDKIPTGGTKTIKITNLDNCAPGSKYSFPKANIKITYDTNTISDKTQMGLADIVGTC